VKANHSEGYKLQICKQLNNLKEEDLKMTTNVLKSIPIEIEMVYSAYVKLRSGGKSPGVDGLSWVKFDEDLDKHLYVVWTRLSSGSYFPRAVREVEIPKKDGSKRKLGIPTLQDRIAQCVIKDYMEERIDQLFHEHSYGYRPMKNAHQALKEVSKNCLQHDWVIDMDISKFFDEIDHETMLKAVAHVIEEKWVLMYVKRWLEAPTQQTDGTLKQKEGKGTPQGGVISPLLANLYLHFTLDKWFELKVPDVSFVRYADDVIVHCKTEQRAKEVLDMIRERLGEVKLIVKESKTKIAYCKDYKRSKEYAHVSFNFLGFSFQPMPAKSQFGKDKYFVIRGTKISDANSKKIIEFLKHTKWFKSTEIELGMLAVKLEPYIRGWYNYYTVFSHRTFYKISYAIDRRVTKWIIKKYKINTRKALGKLAEFKSAYPKLFYHWRKDYFIKTNATRVV
jgi:RNA-directed DNA polymerase